MSQKQYTEISGWGEGICSARTAGISRVDSFKAMQLTTHGDLVPLALSLSWIMRSMMVRVDLLRCEQQQAVKFQFWLLTNSLEKTLEWFLILAKSRTNSAYMLKTLKKNVSQINNPTPNSKIEWSYSSSAINL